MDKTEILFFVADLGGGGAENVLVNLVNNLDPEKYEIEVRTIFNSGVNKSRLLPHIKHSSVFSGKAFKGYTKLLKLGSPKLLYKLFLRKSKQPIQIAFMHHIPTRILAGAPRDKKTFAWVHGSNISTSVYRNYGEFQKCYQSFDGVAFVAQTAENSFLERHSFPIKSRVVYNLIDNKRVLNSMDEPIDIKIDRSKVNLCSVGRLSGEKGFLRLIEALGKIAQSGIRNWHLYLLGEGGEKENLIAKSKELGLESNISFLGYQTNPYKYLSRMDLFVCSSFTEAFSTAVSEAIILGIPVLTTECSGMREIIGDSDAGIIVENSDEGLLNGLKRLLSNPESIKEMSSAAKERSSFFSTEKAVRYFEEFIGTA